ncbi:MAG: urease accessory protein [Hyphomicrobiaceae bacterium]
MDSILLLGFLVGMGHALEADHLAAVSAMLTNKSSPKRLAVMGMTWGIGHTLTLLLVCSFVIFFGFVLTNKVAAVLEFSVGVLLVALGINVLWRMHRDKVHFHAHDHGDGKVHVHAHSHRTSVLPHGDDPHDHKHVNWLTLKPLFVGLVHGAAGSAALLALALAATHEPWTAVRYIVLFGVGSIFGMAALTCVAAWPLKLAQQCGRWAHRALFVAIGVLTIGLGVTVMLETGAFAWGLS